MPQKSTKPATPSPRPGEDAFVLALAGGASMTAACKEAQIDRKTGYRWLDKAHVRQRVEQARSELWDRRVGLLASVQVTAIARAAALITEGRTERIQLDAARTLLVEGRYASDVAAEAEASDLDALDQLLADL